MKLYYSKGACSLSTHIVINELGIKCDFEAVNLATHVTENGTDFYTINKKGAVPTLQLDDGEIITENLVIQQYLVDTHKNNLCPSLGEIKRYHVLEWLSFAASDLHKSFGPFFHYKDAPAEMVEKFTVNLKKKLDILERQLSDRDYISGNEFSLPDAYIFVCLRWLGFAKIDITDWPNLAAYFACIKERPSVVKAMQEEGLV